MDRFEAMTILVAAAEHGSLSAAGRALGKPLSTVSRNVSELEAALGTQLVTRSSRLLSLTDAGRAYVLACKRLLDDLREMERAASGEHEAPRGELVVTAPVGLGSHHVAPIVAEFLAAYPGIDVQLELTDRMVSLAEERVDVAVRVTELPDSSLRAIRVGAARSVVCASPRYWAARGIPKTPSDLAMHDCVTHRGFRGTTWWPFRVGNRDVRAPIHSRFVVNTSDAAVEAAIAGAGITATLSYQVADAVKGGKLTFALERFEPPAVPISLVYLASRFQTQKLRAFCDFAKPRLEAVSLGSGTKSWSRGARRRP